MALLTSTGGILLPMIAIVVTLVGGYVVARLVATQLVEPSLGPAAAAITSSGGEAGSPEPAALAWFARPWVVIATVVLALLAIGAIVARDPGRQSGSAVVPPPVSGGEPMTAPPREPPVGPVPDPPDMRQGMASIERSVPGIASVKPGSPSLPPPFASAATGSPIVDALLQRGFEVANFASGRQIVFTATQPAPRLIYARLHGTDDVSLANVTEALRRHAESARKVESLAASKNSVAVPAPYSLILADGCGAGLPDSNGKATPAVPGSAPNTELEKRAGGPVVGLLTFECRSAGERSASLSQSIAEALDVTSRSIPRLLDSITVASARSRVVELEKNLAMHLDQQTDGFVSFRYEGDPAALLALAHARPSPSTIPMLPASAPAKP